MYSPGRWKVYSCSRAGELEDDRPGVELHGRSAGRGGHVEDLRAQVDGGHREAAVLAASAGHVQLVDARRWGAQLLRGLPDDPARGLDGVLVLAERRGPDDVADAARPEGGHVVDDEAIAVDVGDSGQEGEQLAGGRGDTRGGHGWTSDGRRGDADAVAVVDASASRTWAPVPSDPPNRVRPALRGARCRMPLRRGRILHSSWRGDPAWAAILLAVAMTCLPLAALAQSPTTSPSPSGGPEASQGIAALPLEGTPWRIASLRDGAELRPAEAALASWLTLRAGTLSGDTGCGPLRGSYGTMGSAIRFELLDVPRAARGCGDRATGGRQGRPREPSKSGLLRAHPRFGCAHRRS